MPRKRYPKSCGCGCGEMTKDGQFRPGHDSKLLSAILEKVGGIANLREIVEKALNETVAIARACPECGFAFQGGTWGGMDAHWKANHGGIMTYRKAWPLIRDSRYKKSPNNETVAIAKVCPECNFQFQGGTWGGIDAHWNANHLDIMSYEEAWSLIRDGKYKKKR